MTWLGLGECEHFGAVLDQDSLPGKLFAEYTFALRLGEEQHRSTAALGPGEVGRAQAAGGPVDGRCGDPVAGAGQFRFEPALA